MVPRAVKASAVARLTTSAFGTGLTVTVIQADPVASPESVTEAVIVCVPTLKLLVEKLAPDPIGPFTLDDQDRPALRVPSWASLALPAKPIGLPTTKADPL